MLGLFSRDRNLVRLEVRRALNRPARATFCWGSEQAWTSGGVRASSGRDTMHARRTRLLSLPRVPAAPEALCAPRMEQRQPGVSMSRTQCPKGWVSRHSQPPIPARQPKGAPRGWTHRHMHTYHTHTHTDTHRHMHTHLTHTQTHTQIHTDACTHITHTHRHTHRYTRTHAHIAHTHTDTHT